jgi:hypothetical protein
MGSVCSAFEFTLIRPAGIEQKQAVSKVLFTTRHWLPTPMVRSSSNVRSASRYAVPYTHRAYNYGKSSILAETKNPPHYSDLYSASSN